MRRVSGFASVVAIALGALLVGCSGSSATATPTPPASLSLPEQGQQLYLTKGCSACHGLSAEGSDIAPAYRVTMQTRSGVRFATLSA